jgi:phosphomannomutase/phosphoglucomutase
VLNLAGFQVCDVRGVYGTDAAAQISPLHACLIGQAVASRIPADATIVVSGDGRASTPALLSALVSGLKRPCLDLGAGVPTPLAYLAKHLRGAHTSAIVTASHNPASFNGIKLQLGALPITPSEMAAIRDDVASRYAKFGTVPSLASVPTGDTALAHATWEAYVVAARQAFGRGENAGVAVDCMHGCYSGRARELLDGFGYRVVTLRDERDGTFHGIEPDPSADRNLAPLIATVRGGGVVFGVALDGDGDRARFVDERGVPVDNGTVLALFVRYLLESGRAADRRAVVYDQKTRLAVIAALRRYGAEPLVEKSGHTFIRTRMLREDALFGGEKSGHFFWGGGTVYPVASGDCGLFAAVAMGEVLRFFGKPLSALAADVPDSPFYTGDIRGLRYDGDRGRLLDAVASAVGRSAYRVSTEDGVRVEAPDAFAHLRASVTETGMLTAAFDAADRDGLRRMVGTIVRALPPDAAAIGRSIEARVT